MSPCRRFHSIAALCGNGLRSELQALFERLAVDPHSELFVRNDGMVQSGPDPISAEAPLPQTTGEARTSNAGCSQILFGVINSSPQTETRAFSSPVAILPISMRFGRYLRGAFRL